jgi:predicted kinase
LEEPDRRPCLVLAGGLPGTGKSSLARELGEHAHFHVLRTDLVRKELAGRAGRPSQPVTKEDLYTARRTEETYAECLRRAERLLFEGERVLVDATFREDRRRRAFLEAAARWGVPSVVFLCEAPPEVVRARLEGRRGDASDADWPVYQHLAGRWEEPGAFTAPFVRRLLTDDSREHVRARALAELRDLGLLNGERR